MDSRSQDEMMVPGQPNQGTSVSAFMDAIAMQEKCFEQSLASQQEKLKAITQKTMAAAAEVNKILTGEKSVPSEVKTEEFNSKRVCEEWDLKIQPLSPKNSRSKSRSTFFQHPEVYKDHRRHSPDHVSKRDFDKFNSFTPYDHHKDHRSSGRRENRRSPSYRRSSSIERSWKREIRSPSKSKPWRYSHEDSRSPRLGSLRYQSSDGSDRYHRGVRGSPIDDSIPHHRRSIDSRKQRERRGASPLEIGRRHRSRDTSVEDYDNDHRDYRDEMIIEPTSTRSRYPSKQSLHGNSQIHATSETPNAKAPCLT